MFNHKLPKTAYWTYDHKNKGFAIEAVTDIKAGEEIYLKYGAKPN